MTELITRAAIYGPARDVDRWRPLCADWCAARGYQLLAVVAEDAAARWGDLLRMLASRQVDVVVVATLADLPPDRAPRVEIVGRGRPARRPGLRAVIYGPGGGTGAQWERRGMRWCQQAGYRIHGLVAETPDATRWGDVVRMMADGDVDLVVMETWGHLPPHRVPRVEVAGTSPPGLLQPRAAGWYL